LQGLARPLPRFRTFADVVPMIFGHAPSFGRVIFGYIKGTRHRILSIVTIGEEISEKYILMNTCRGGTKNCKCAESMGLGAVRPVRVPTKYMSPTQPSLRTACMHLGKYLPAARYRRE